MKKLGFIVLLSFCFSLFSCNNNTSKYSTYNLSCVGDSITWGYNPNTGVQMDEPYPVVLKNKIGFGAVSNYGISGSTLCNGTNSYAPMVDRMERINSSCNLIIVWGGCNDYFNDCSLGSSGDEDASNVYGALYQICYYLQNNFSNSFIMFITPLPYKFSSEVSYLEDVKDAIISVAYDQFKFPVLNLTHNSDFEDELNAGTGDGVHPSQSYVKNILVPKIISFIKENL